MTERPTRLAETWDYVHAHANREKLIQHVAKNDGEFGAKLRTALTCGGKAFGLTIAEKIAAAANKIASGLKFVVPRWQAFQNLHSSQEQILHHFRGSDTIIRSSALDEDWRNGESGVEQSYVFDSTWRLEKFLHSSLAESQKTPVVIQEYKKGVGIVVDLAWSPLLNRLVGRVAWGRASHYFLDRTPGPFPTIFSSATWDSQGPQGVYCPLTGEELVTLRSSRPLATQPQYSSELVQVLYRVLSAWDWPGGVQCELIVHPRDPHLFHLVQIRPSPLQAQGALPATWKNIPPQARLAFSTAGVNGPFYYQGTPCVADENGVRETPDTQNEDSIVLLWDCPTWADPCVEIMEYAGKKYRAHVAASILSNTAHGMPERRHRSRDLQQFRTATQGCALLSSNLLIGYDKNVSTHHTPRMKQIVRHAKEVLLVSDSLVGALYTL